MTTDGPGAGQLDLFGHPTTPPVIPGQRPPSRIESNDVDLMVTDPGGTRVFEGNRGSTAGLHLDRDCPGDGCGGQNIENIFFDGLDPPRGSYRVEVRLADLKGAQAPVHVRFGARWFQVFTSRLDFDSWRRALPAPLSPMLMRGRPLHREARRIAGQPEQFLDALDAWQVEAESPGS